MTEETVRTASRTPMCSPGKAAPMDGVGWTPGRCRLLCTAVTTRLFNIHRRDSLEVENDR